MQNIASQSCIAGSGGFGLRILHCFWQFRIHAHVELTCNLDMIFINRCTNCLLLKSLKSFPTNMIQMHAIPLSPNYISSFVFHYWIHNCTICWGCFRWRCCIVIHIMKIRPSARAWRVSARDDFLPLAMWLKCKGMYGNVILCKSNNFLSCRYDQKLYVVLSHKNNICFNASWADQSHKVLILHTYRYLATGYPWLIDYSFVLSSVTKDA